MVGVPGRSKGCNTCRKRKIACSLERPHCFQCVKSGRTCMGYQKERVFITSVASTDPPQSTWRPDAYTKESRPGAPRRKPASPSAADDYSLIHHEGLGKATVRDQILGIYLSQVRTAASLAGSQPPWMTMIPNLPRASKALEMAAFAVSTARIGRDSNDPDHPFIRTSLKLYNQGLNAMQHALSNPKVAYSDETLAACVLLSMYEIFECPAAARSGYLSHYAGCAKLVQLRGPEAHRSGMAHGVFLAFRTMGTMEGLLRKETFLSDPVWKTVPFSELPKSPYDKLLDLILEAPAIMCRADKLDRMKSPKMQLRELLIIIKELWRLDGNMHQFHDDLRARANGPLYWPVFATTRKKVQDLDNEDDRELFPLDYHFIDTKVGTTMILYWAAMTTLWSGMCQIYHHIDRLVEGLTAAGLDLSDLGEDGVAPSTANLPPLDKRTGFISLAHNVFQSVEFCTRDTFGLPFTTAPLNMLVHILSDHPEYVRETEWAKSQLEQILQRGVIMVKYLPKPNDLWN